MRWFFEMIRKPVKDKNTSVRIASSDHQKLVKFAQLHDRTLNFLINRAIREFLDRNSLEQPNSEKAPI